MFRKILVPLDGTDESQGILPYVTQIASSTDTSILLHTVVVSDTLPRTVETAGAVIHQDQIEASLSSHAKDSLDSIARRLESDGVEAGVRVTVGSPPEEIMAVAEGEGCGLIAMSTHGRNLISRGILGSVTDKVVHSAALPVLTITPQRARAYQEAEGTSIDRVVLPLDGSDLAATALPYVEYSRWSWVLR